MTLAQARRTALAAQGLHVRRRERTGPVTARQLQGVVDRVGLLQIDSVNVMARAHLMPLYSRLGPYDPALLDRAASRAPRRLVEAWAHQASYVPPRTYRLLGWRQRAYRTEAWGSIAGVPMQHAAEVEAVRQLVAERGPLTGAQVHEQLEGSQRADRTEWGWNWTTAKRVLEFLFFTGELTAAGRNGAFERRYDLTERVLPADVLAEPEPAEDDAVRALVEIGARAHGVGTVRCFGDYFRIRGPRLRRAVDELVEDGTLEPVEVVGWDRPVYRHRDATTPRRAAGRCLLSPFDPLVFERRRLEELFGVRYRIEIYVPAPQRVWGYYCLPFLLGEHVAALVDLKADRQDGVLRVHAAHHAPQAPGVHRQAPDPQLVADELALELELTARWLGLDGVVVGDRDGVARGELVSALNRAEAV
jgi:uncharacterized protein YcaQ